MENRLEPLEDLVGELFVNRQAEFDLFTRWVDRIPRMTNNSYALIGRRRTGKTAILVKLFNRLFYAQDRVMPVYISFARYLHFTRPLTMQEVGEHYLSSYLLSFLAFRYRRPDLLRREPKMSIMREIALEFDDAIVNDLIKEFDLTLTATSTGDGPAQLAINAPRQVAGLHNLLTAVIVDEFQVLTTVHDPIQNIDHDLTDSFQWAVDTRLAPMLVSGSAVSLLVSRALTGMLQGRFSYWYLEPLAREDAYHLVFRLAQVTGATVNEELAEAIWQLTSGYPYSIRCLLASNSPAWPRLPALDALEEVVTFELTDHRGQLWQHYREEFEKYSHQLNEGYVTRKVMLWATKYPDQRIDAEAIAQEIGLDVGKVETALEKLRWVDVVEKVGLISYKGPTDPMLRRFIEYQHYTEIEKLGPDKAIQDWQREIQAIRGNLNRALGEIGELYARMVMRGFDGRSVEGMAYFNHSGLLLLPKFERIERRGGIVVAGNPVEIDVIAEWRNTPTDLPSVWLVEAKYTQERIDVTAVRHFLTQAAHLREHATYASITRWYFSKSGFTQAAVQLLQSSGVLYSDWRQFRTLAGPLGFVGLPA